MKIQVKSDLHKETRPGQYRLTDKTRKSLVNPEADLLILAGDITDFRERFALHHELLRLGRPVLYIPGNHEYYRADNVSMVMPELRAMYGGTNVKVMDRDYVILGDYVFIGATFWTDLTNPLDRQVAQGFLNDFRVPGLSTDWYCDQHLLSLGWLKGALARFFGKKVVVITHHCPSPLSVHPRFKGDAANCCFVTDQSSLMMQEGAPLLWIHGHTHDSFDYRLGNTRVVCNPKGYPGERAQTKLSDEYPYPPFTDDLLIDLSDPKQVGGEVEYTQEPVS